MYNYCLPVGPLDLARTRKARFASCYASRLRARGPTGRQVQLQVQLYYKYM